MRHLLALCIALSSLLALPAIAGAQPADLGLEVAVQRSGSPLAGSVVAARHAGDGSGRLFLVQQSGIIWVWDGDEVLAVPFLDIEDLVDDAENEQGLLGLAFHPDYESNGFFYVNYTHDPGAGLDRTRVDRFTVSAGDPDVADPGSRQPILELAQDFGNHNGGDLHFSPADGYLYVAVGDGGGGGDPNDRAQDYGEILGSILRIDVDGTPPPSPNDLCGLVTNYDIPADNPFAGGSGDCDEIWAPGMRNPYRFSFDRATGDLFIGDVGQSAFEEVDYQPAGGPEGSFDNFGWDCREGAHPYTGPGSSSPLCPGRTLTDPILEYSHFGGPFVCTVTGGYRYRGRIASLQGRYLYADYCSDQIFVATEGSPGDWSALDWTSHGASGIVSFNEDEEGELYVIEQFGDVLRFTGDVAIGLFGDDLESGDMTAWTATSPTGDLEVGDFAYTGSFGLRVAMADTDPAYVQDDSPVAEKAYHARFYARNTELALAPGDDLDLLVASSCSGPGPETPTAPHLAVILRGDAAVGRQAVVAARQNDGSWLESPAVDLAIGRRAFEVHWEAATTGTSDGSLAWWIDGHPQSGLSGLDNDQAAIDCVRWGAASGVAPGSVDPASFLDLDDFDSRRSEYIGLLSAFGDVPEEHPFWRFVHSVYNAEITVGCGGGDYCPESSTTRAQMAVFVLLAHEGPGFVPSPCVTSPFGDVPAGDPFCPWIQELFDRGVVAGCGGGNYCPGAAVTREQMAVFLLATLEGSGYTPPPCETPPFDDVPVDSGFCPWIQDLAARGITAGCGGGNYCPDSPNTRGEMAVFLSATFGLAVPEPNP